MRGSSVAVLLLGLLATFAPRAFAQDDTETNGADVDNARRHYEAGTSYYEQLRYADAAREFEVAYRLSGRVHLLKNVAMSHQHAEVWDAAIAALERYLDEAPDAEDRTEVTARIERLRELAEGSAEGTSSQPERDVAQTEPERDGGTGIAPWLLLGAGAAVAGAGSIVLVLANGAASDVESSLRGTEWDDVAGDADDADTFSLVGGLLIGVGAAAIVAGLGWAIAGGGSDDEATVTLGPGGAVLRGRL